MFEFQGVVEVFMIFLAGANVAMGAMCLVKREYKTAAVMFLLAAMCLGMSYYAIKLIVLLRRFQNG